MPKVSAPVEPPSEAAFFIDLYRTEKAAALARGLDLTPHIKRSTINARPFTRPIGNIGDGNFQTLPLDPDRYLER